MGISPLDRNTGTSCTGQAETTGKQYERKQFCCVGFILMLFPDSARRFPSTKTQQLDLKRGKKNLPLKYTAMQSAMLYSFSNGSIAVTR